MDGRSRQSNTRLRATLVGFTAVAMWSLLALLTDATNGVPPFQTAAFGFAIGTLVGLVWHASRQQRDRLWPTPGQWPAYAAGIGGLFGYHALYFAALKSAPAVEASLIAYLWPLLIVLGSALLPGERLGWHHLAGALTGFAGTAVIVTGGATIGIDIGFLPGYALALAAAFTWAAYSLLARRFSDVPTSAVIVFCAASAALAAACSAIFEVGQHAWPLSVTQMLGLIGLGLLPVGAAFYVWDHGVKHGDIQLVGVASYAAPVLSTCALIVAGRATPSWALATATALITAGALLAARDTLRRR